MGKKKLTARRAATFLASAGMLVMSSGVALMVTATPAEAANKVGICHATSSDTNPYVYIEVDDDSVKLKGHLQHRNDPNKRWKSAGTFNGVQHVADQPKPDIIGSFTDDQGVFQQMDGVVTAATCESQTPPEVFTAVADVDFQDPTCANENVAGFEVTVEHATWEITDGEAAPGKTIEITFTADQNAAFEDGAQTVFTYEFDEAESPCDIVLPPEEVVPAAPTFGDPDCETAPSYTLPDPAPVTTSPLPDLKRSAALIETKDVDGVQYVVEGDLVPGGTITVTATALEGYVIAEGAQTVWEHTFAEVEDCEVPPAPPVDTETPGTTVATPTVVSAGLTDAADLRGAQGMALLVTGMIMMVFAGGLGLRKSQA